MTATVRTIIRCDGVMQTGRTYPARCPAEHHSTNAPVPTRNALRALGWTRNRDQDFCPDPRHTRTGE